MAPLATIAALALLAHGGVTGAAADSRRSGASDCFLVSQYRQWRDHDARTLYIRVNVHDIYRLTTAAACPILTYPNAQLVIRTDGSNAICTASDWDLAVSKGTGGLDTPIPCQVRTMTKLTPSEASALPARDTPD